MSALDDFINPNEERVRIEQARAALAWNLHVIYFHSDASEADKNAQTDKVLAVARAKFGDVVVKGALDDLNAHLRRRVGGNGP